MATIQRQLGEGDGKAQEVAELNEAIAKAKMPPEAESQARKELRRYERMPEAAAEAGMVRSYLDWLIELPWACRTRSRSTSRKPGASSTRIISAWRRSRRRIIEYLAVRKLAPQGKAPILCFVGPPGVGKTSLGQSIARAMERPFVRVSLGGVHDEAEIRGHRRTYIGALPGNIIQAIKKAGARNCVMMLDEIDKMGRGIQGDPSAAMLEVLDPEQNATFRDNYLGVPFDLSRVVFIATANMLDTVPGPLLDRMEIISLAGYTEDEKLEIARRYLVRRQLEANGLKAEQAEIEAEALQAHHQGLYPRGRRSQSRARNRQGVPPRRGPDRRRQRQQGHASPRTISLPCSASPASKTRSRCAPAFPVWRPASPGRRSAATSSSSRRPARPARAALILTGQLGDVMRESAQAALTLVKSRASQLGIDPSMFEKSDIHVHVPAGATPKDGPSAGVAMFTALASLLTDRTVSSDTAMTGEISLRGLVLPVGGIKEKVVAAAAAGLTRVMLPARNRRDFDDIPQGARDKLEFVWLERVDDAIAAALEGTAKTTLAAAK